jgi:hypothetical protein
MGWIGTDWTGQADTDTNAESDKTNRGIPNESNFAVSDLVPVVSDHSTRQ